MGRVPDVERSDGDLGAVDPRRDDGVDCIGCNRLRDASGIPSMDHDARFTFGLFGHRGARPE